MRGLITILGMCLLLLAACGDPGELIIVPENESPPDLTVPQVVKENFVNRVYITLLGRKPQGAELTSALSLLDQDNASVDQRTEVIETVLVDPAYKERQYNIARIDLLNNFDTTDIALFQAVFTQYLTDPQYEQFIDLINYELNRLDELSKAPIRYFDGSINRAEMHQRMVNNQFYDEINMGTQNFVLSVFEHFLNRYPTEAEEQQAILMCDGFYSVCFSTEGNSKEDFLDILIESDAYREGQVLDLYEALLFRDPNSQEMTAGALQYGQTNSYDSLLLDIMISEEFLGR